MTDLMVFDNPEFGQVRTFDIEGEPWFVGTDIAKALGYSKLQDAVARHVDDDDSTFHGVIDSRGRTQQTKIINESGMYALIIMSELPSAKKFKRWITKEVIPSIVKTGSYNLPQLTTSELVLKIAENNVELERQLAEVKQNQHKLESKLDTALQVFSRPNIDHWKADVENKIDAIVESQQLSPVAFRGKLYRELEQTANARLQNRLSHLKGRMKRQGASYKERQAMSKLDIISKDKQLRAIFEGVVARQQAVYDVQGNLQ